MAAIIAVVLRLSDVAVSEAGLESQLNRKPDRYVANGSLSYAQVDLSIDDLSWRAIEDFVSQYGLSMTKLVESGQIGRAALDVAVGLAVDRMSASVTIPSSLASMAGKFGVDIEISVYRLGDDQPDP